MKLSNNFTLEELTASTTAKAKGIDNTPTADVTAKLTKLANEVLQPVRNKYGKPIAVSSGYRSPKLNAAIGGSKTSQHMTGEAADLKDAGGNNKALFDLIQSMVKDGSLKVGQLIDEYGYKWVHVSLPRTGKPNNQILHLK